MRLSLQNIGLTILASFCVLASRLAGKLVVPNAFDSKETPSHRVGMMPCYCDRGTAPRKHGAIGIVLAAIGAAITRWRLRVHQAGITAVRRVLGLKGA